MAASSRAATVARPLRSTCWTRSRPAATSTAGSIASSPPAGHDGIRPPRVPDARSRRHAARRLMRLIRRKRLASRRMREPRRRRAPAPQARTGRKQYRDVTRRRARRRRPAARRLHAGVRRRPRPGWIRHALNSSAPPMIAGLDYVGPRQPSVSPLSLPPVGSLRVGLA